MRKIFTQLALVLAVMIPGCKADLGGLQVLGVEELAALRAGGADFSVCDANSEDTRRRFGVIPGAILLTSYRDYEPAAELPADKDRRLVFYCHSEWCGAAADAAQKAIAAGYREVWVMAPGIKGWRAADQPVDSVASAEVSG
jgi:rhodanese-related sulfurtransferase